MKKLVMAALLAAGVLAASQQRASAWSEFKFSAGVNFGWVGGGNRILWGLYHSAPYPGGQDVAPCFPGVAAALGYNPYNGCCYGPTCVPNLQIPTFGYNGAPAAGAATTAPVGAGMPQAYNPYYNSGYQPVGYYPGYSAYQAPSYWYGR
jgi:hypothetical protein